MDGLGVAGLGKTRTDHGLEKEGEQTESPERRAASGAFTHGKGWNVVVVSFRLGEETGRCAL